MHERAHGLGPQDDLIARLDMLQPRGQRAVLHLDRVELQFLVPIGRGDGIGAQERFDLAGLWVRIAHQADHHELARAEAQDAGRVTRKENSRSVQCFTLSTVCASGSVTALALSSFTGLCSVMRMSGGPYTRLPS